MPRGIAKNGVRKKAAPKTFPDNVPVVPKRQGGQPRAIPPTRKRGDEAQRWVKLEDRVRAASIRQKGKKAVTLKMGLDEYERLVELAETHDEEMMTVLRACLRFGLKHAEQFAGVGGGFFDLGDWRGRAPSSRDPLGLNRPGAPMVAPFRQPAHDAVNPRFQAPLDPPRPMTVTETYDEPVWTPPAPKPSRGLLPSAPQPGERTILHELADQQADAAASEDVPWEAGELGDGGPVRLVPPSITDEVPAWAEEPV